MTEPQIKITSEFLKLIAEIDEFKGRWEALKQGSPQKLDRLRKIATIESIGSSTRIEGVKLTDVEIETLLSGLDRDSFTTRDEQEVGGYAEAMDTVFLNFEELAITENRIKQLHQILLRHSDRDERHRGNYKKFSNNIAAFDASGDQIGVIFETATPFDTPFEMETLVDWANRTDLHPLLSIAVFVVKFLAIHPFQDGNGRLSRILTTLMLLRAGYAYVPFFSLESIVEQNKDLYYNALRRTQTTLRSDPDWEPWIRFFLQCLKKQATGLSSTIKDVNVNDDEDLSLHPLSKTVLRLLHENEQLSISDLARLAGANKSTLKVRIGELIAAGEVVRHGKGRGVWYSLAK